MFSKKLKIFKQKKNFLFLRIKLIDLIYKPITNRIGSITTYDLGKKLLVFKKLKSYYGTQPDSILVKSSLVFNNDILFKKFLLLNFFLNNSIFLKAFFFTKFFNNSLRINFFLKKLSFTRIEISNLVPLPCFNTKFTKTLVLFKSNLFLKENILPWTYNTIIRFMEFCSGKKSILQVYPFMNQAIDLDYVILYKRWLPRFFAFERRLGHRFFLEEAFHIMHMSFNLHDIKLISTWLKAIITRISFWKTRFIFRFLKYIFNNYFIFLFSKIGVKGFKVKLKGKISVAGNSRKRSILYRVGKTSHATCDLKVLHNFSTIVTFTGVLGFQVWIFY